MNRRYVFFTIFLAAAFPGAGKAQVRMSDRLPQLSERPVCSEEASDPSSNTRAARLRFISYLRTESECGALPGERWSLGDGPPRQALPEFSGRDPIETELRQFGAAGYSIAVARQNVMAILRESNSCSAWYLEAEPDPAQKFASLRFQTDSSGEDSAVGEYEYSGVIYREPYVARAQQGVAAGSIITLNSHGAFFVLYAPIRLRLGAGGPLVPQAQKPLHVGTYDGGSLNAQITTLLHEYGHIVGLLPVDMGEAGSPLLSTQNTETVLDRCRRQIEASANRAVALSISLAVPEQKVKHR